MHKEVGSYIYLIFFCMNYYNIIRITYKISSLAAIKSMCENESNMEKIPPLD